MRLALALSSLREPEARLKQIIDALPTAAWFVASDGHSEFHNAAGKALFALDVSGGWLNLAHPKTRRETVAEWSALRTSMASGCMAVRLGLADRTERWMSVDLAPAYDADGVFLGWCCSATDTSMGTAPPVSAEDEATKLLLRVIGRLIEENQTLREDYGDLFEEAPIAYVHEDLDSRFIRANRAALTMLGLKADQVPGILGSSLVAPTPEAQRTLEVALASIRMEREPPELVMELRRADDGEPVWVNWWSKPSANGAFTRTMMLDITDRVRIAQTKAALEFSIEAGQVGDWDLDLVRDTSCRSFRHDKCFGYDAPIPEDCWGREVFLRHVHPKDRAMVAGGMAAAVESGNDWEAEFRVIWPDTSLHWLIARGRVYAREAGIATRMLGVVMDVTERHWSEEALRETKAALEFALQSTKIGDWDLDLRRDNSRRSLRHDQCFGYIEPVPKWGVEEFIHHIHPDDRAGVQSGMEDAVAALKDWSSEFRVVWPDGSLHWLFAGGSIYRTLEGRAARMLGIVMDITDRKEADLATAQLYADLKASEAALHGSDRLARGQVEALTRTLDAVAKEATPDKLVEHVLRTLVDKLAAHSATVWRQDTISGLIAFEGVLEAGRYSGQGEEVGGDRAEPASLSEIWPCEAVFLTGQSVVIDDIGAVGAFRWRNRLLELGVITILFVPMSIAGRVAGMIALRFTEPRIFRPDEIDLAQALANQAMLATQFARLSSQAQQAAVVAERNRMARDIHDTLAQGFTGIIVQLQAAEDARERGLPTESDQHLARAVDVARESLQEARRSVRALRPLALQDRDLENALQGLFEKMTRGTKVKTRVVVSGVPRGLPADWEDNLVRIGQEALTNVLRYTEADEFAAHIAFSSEGVAVDLRDDGRGFDSSAASEGLGLVGMRERVAAIGGVIRIESAAGKGVAIRIELPNPLLNTEVTA